MSTAHIITTIAVMFGLLLAFAFISQVQQRRIEQRNRLASALKARSRKVMNLLNAQPKQFLGVDLQVLLLNKLLETSETLATLEPKVESHKKNIMVLAERIDQAQSPGNVSKKVKITDLEKIKEVHKSLEDLYIFVRTLAQKQEITADEANKYNHQIKERTFELSTSFNEIHAKSELKEGRNKVALHYFKEVVNLHRNSPVFGSQTRIAELEPLIAELNQKVEEEKYLEQQKNQSETATDEDSFSGIDELWKKRNVYD